MDQVQITGDIQELAPAQMAQDLVKLETLAKQIKARIDLYKEKLLEEMRDKKVLSLKMEDMTVSRVERKTVKVIDDKILQGEIEATGNAAVMKFVVDMDYMKPVVTDMLQKGELDGATLTTTEYIAVRINK